MHFVSTITLELPKSKYMSYKKWFRNSYIKYHINFPLAVFVIIFYLANSLISLKKESIEERINSEMSHSISAAHSSLNDVLDRLSMLSHFIQKSSSTVNAFQNDTEMQNLVSNMTHLFERHGNLEYFRLLNTKGHEILHLRKQGYKIIVSKPSQLQDKSNRDYFLNAIKLKPSEVKASRVDLNKEYGKIEYPIKPVIRFFGPINDYKNENLLGTFSINYNFQNLIENALREFNNKNIYIINQDGHWIYGHPKYSFDFEYENSQENTFFNLHPHLEKIFSNNETSKFSIEKEGIGFLKKHHNQFNGRTYYIYQIVSNEVVNKELRSTKALLYVILLMSFFITLFFGHKIYLNEKRKDENNFKSLKRLEDEKWLNRLLNISRETYNFTNVIPSYIEALKNMHWETKYEQISFYRLRKLPPLPHDLFQTITKAPVFEFNEEVSRIYIQQGMSYLFDIDTKFAKLYGKSIIIPLQLKNRTFGLIFIPLKKTFLIESWYKTVVGNICEIINKNIDNIRIYEKIKQQEKQILESQKFDSMGVMAGGLAHEINNPLAIISALNDIIHRKPYNTDKVIDYSLKIEEQVQRIKKISANLLSLYDTKEKLMIKETSIVELLNTIYDEFYIKLSNRDIRFFIPEMSSEIMINVDPRQFGQVLHQLIENSLDVVNELDEKWIKIEYKRENNFEILRVIDSGNGIEKDIVDKLTDPFFTTKDVGVGTGLGLSVVRRIIENYGGKFYYELHNEMNTSFVLEIPIIIDQNDTSVDQNSLQNAA